MKYKTAKMLGAFAGHWFMAESNVRALMQAVASAGELPKVGGKAPAPYSLVNGIAMIDVSGVLTKDPLPEGWDEYLGTCPTMPIIGHMEAAASDPEVQAIALVIDSPGGMVAGTNQLAESIAAVNKDRKPCYAIISDLAASGGYYLASQCERIFANEMAEVGSIGVYSVLADDSKFWEDLGISLTLVSTGGVKGAGADGRVTPELIADVQRGVNAMRDKFVKDVASGRSIGIDEARALADGRVWIAPEAKRLNLIDDVCAFGDAVKAITQEVRNMTQESFDAYAKEHPEAVNRFVEQGRKTGISDGREQARQELAELVKAAGGFMDIAVEAFARGAGVDVVESQAKERKAAAAEIDKLKAQVALLSQDNKTIGTQAKEPAPTTDPAAQAGAEWEKMNEVERSAWLDKDTFVRVRARELKS